MNEYGCGKFCEELEKWKIIKLHCMNSFKKFKHTSGQISATQNAFNVWHSLYCEIDWTGPTLLEKINSLSSNNTGWDFQSIPLSVMDFGLSWAYFYFVGADTTIVKSHSCGVCCCVQMTLLPWNHLPPLALTLSAPLLQWSLGFKRNESVFIFYLGSKLLQYLILLSLAICR